MDRYIFNKKYFDDEFLKTDNGKQNSQEEKLRVIYEKTGISESGLKNKFIRKKGSRGYRSISEQDYKLVIDKVDPLLILDTERLLDKLISRINLDLSSNEQYVLYRMLCCLDGKKQEWVSPDELFKEIKKLSNNEKYKLAKIKKVLEECEVTIDNKGKKRKLYQKDEEGAKYAINMDALILFTDL